MLATTQFSVNRGADDDWFDPILNADTCVFVDPFLIFRETDEFWAGAHDRIIAHFDQVFLLIAEGNRNPESIQYKKALDLLLFPEPRELCLGYTSQGTGGAGSGRVFARAIAAAIVAAIVRGITHPRHFEELGILNEGIGADRISDITCTVLKERLVTYTQEIARRHSIPLTKHQVYGAHFDSDRLRWERPVVEVPTNPATGGPLLLVPQRFLRDLPVLNAYDWWASSENEQLRLDMNYDIMTRVNKATIVAAARAHPEAVRAWTIAKESQPARPYNFATDPKGVWVWDAAGAHFAQQHPLLLRSPSSQEGFFAIIEQVIRQYRLFVEEQGGWRLLWNSNGDEKPESAAQLLFRGIAQHYCRANDISLDAEVNLGRGPVDFKFSNGYRRRAHLELKKLHNGMFWNGLEQQLPSYMRSDDVVDGWFLAVRYRSNKSSEDRVRTLPNRVLAVALARELNLRFGLVDARPKESASNL
jgi:hypothetical protein